MHSSAACLVSIEKRDETLTNCLSNRRLYHTLNHRQRLYSSTRCLHEHCVAFCPHFIYSNLSEDNNALHIIHILCVYANLFIFHLLTRHPNIIRRFSIMRRFNVTFG